MNWWTRGFAFWCHEQVEIEFHPWVLIQVNSLLGRIIITHKLLNKFVFSYQKTFIKSNSSEQLGRLQDDIKVAKTAFEEDVKTQTMDIALLKDALLEVQNLFSNLTKSLLNILFTSLNTQFYESWIFCLFTFWVFFPDKSFKLISKYTQKCQYNSLY